MAVPGRKQKENSRTRHEPKHGWVDITDVPFDGPVPKLPGKRANGKAWPARIKRKWASWSRMPHCILWTETDWEFALESLEVAALFHETGASNLATELRNREKLMGTTIDYRRGLHIRYVEPQEENPDGADVSNLNDYRDRL